MRKLLHKLAVALLFGLSFAPVALIGGWNLLEDLPTAFILLTLDVPLAFLLSLVPGHVGGKVRAAQPVQPVVHRFETESDLRFLAEDAERRKKPLRVPLCVLVMLMMLAGVVLLPIPSLEGIRLFHRVVQGLLTAVLIPFALMLLLDEANRVTTTCVSGFVVYLVASIYLVFDKNEALTRALYVLGLCFLVAAGLFLNEQALTTGAASRSSGRPSPRLVRRNRLLLLALAAIGAIVLYFDQLRQAASRATKTLLHWLWEAFVWLSNLFMGGSESGGGETGGEDDLSMLLEGGETGAFWKYTEKILIALAFVLAALIALWLGRKVYRLIKKGVLHLIEKLRGVTRSLGEDYVDEQESLMDWGDLSRGVKDDFKKRLMRLTRREKKWEQMDAREKVRALVQRMYRKAGPGLESLTIREAAPLLPRGSASEEAVAALYEQARYAPVAPTQEQAEQLRRDVRA